MALPLGFNLPDLAVKLLIKHGSFCLNEGPCDLVIVGCDQVRVVVKCPSWPFITGLILLFSEILQAEQTTYITEGHRVGNVIPWSLTALDLLRADVPSLAQDNREIPLVLIALTFKFLVWILRLAFQSSPPPISPSDTLASPFFSSRNWGCGYFPSLYCPPTWNKCSDHSRPSKMAVTFPTEALLQASVLFLESLRILKFRELFHTKDILKWRSSVCEN